MTNKRGQAALEFLSTYGFAFLIILVMVGALTYFGVLNPQGFVPSRCSVGEAFGCQENQLTKTGTGAQVVLVIKNTKTTSMDFNSVAPSGANATAEGFGAAVSSAACVWTPAVPTAVAPGNTVTLTCQMNGGYPNGNGAANFPAKGQKIKVAVDFAYHETGNTLWNTARADIINTLQ